MRIHKGRGAAYDVDKERQWNWYRPKRGDAMRQNGAVHHLSREELQEFAREQGLILSDSATFRAVRHA